jgi:glycosyltransferase involved in cell wall biosynthesis
VGSSAGIVQDWVVADGGAERVALELSRLLPTAPIHTTFLNDRILGGAFTSKRVHTWPLQRLPGAVRAFRAFLPLYPTYFDRLDLRRYDLVVSSSIAFAHAVRTRQSATHISYVHTPVRYGWDIDTYLKGSSWPRPVHWAARAFAGRLRGWDRAHAGRSDVVVANSETVRARIQRYWDRDAEVIHPPVDVDEIELSARDDGYLLLAARMLAYRRLDIAVEAATTLGRDLIVVGDGPERRRLQAMAGPTVRFLGTVSRPQLLDLYAGAHAYLVPGLEDFGIAPVEAMATGKPVVGFGRGGVAETVLEGETGVLFDRQDATSMADAIERLDSVTFDRVRIRSRAEAFSAERFRDRFVELLQRHGVDASLYARDRA